MTASTSTGETCAAAGDIEALIGQERVLDALALLRGDESAPWDRWRDADSLVLASRVVSMAGDPRLSRALSRRAWQLAPRSPKAAYYHATDRLARHGPYELLRWMDAKGLGLADREPTERHEADLLALRARVLGQFRDFTAAEALIERARRAFPDTPWLLMEQSDLLRAQDRYDEALELSAEVIRLCPLRRWAVRTRSDLLRLRGRDDEALALLQDVVARTQSGYLALDLASALEETGRHADILSALDLAESRLVLATRKNLLWSHARRCDALHRLGRDEEAREAALAAADGQSGYYASIAERLASPEPDTRRVHLPVGFVRQHHMTCAPATIAAVAGYWGQHIDHEKLTADICYDGTPDHAERHWLVERGWIVREFTADWPTAVALLDRGCPFLIVTVAIGSAHMQAAIGYDSRIKTLLVRDPYERTFSEWNAEPVLREQAAFGPRGLVLLPPEKASLLDGLVLPEEAVHDAWFAFRRALFLHRRDAAATALDTLEKLSPDHALAHRARRDLAHYDGHPAAALPCIEALRRLYPEQVNFQLEHIDLLEQLGRDNEARELLDRLGSGRNTYLTLQRRRAQNRLADARTAPRAGMILRRILRFNACHADNLRAYANHLWGAGDRAGALSVYRLAATSGDKAEHHWRAFFSAARWQRREPEVLDLLRARFARWGDLSDQPARTLAEALEDIDRDEEALAVLHEGRRRRPLDGDLALHLAQKLARHGRRDEAAVMLEAARPHCAPGFWQRHAARMADREFDHARALSLWREIAARAPSDIEAQESCARLLRVCEGRTAAIAWLDVACAAAPRFYALRRTRLEWLRDEPAETALAAADELLALAPDDAWALRERAFILRRLGRGAEGVESARAALAIEPRAPASHCALTRCLRDAGRLAEAREAALAGILLDIDASHLFNDLVLASATIDERRAAVRRIADELVRQVSFNGAVLDYAEVARGVIDEPERLDHIRRAQAAQPDHWSTGSALAACLAEQNQLDAARASAEANTARFPLVPRVWLDLADVLKKLGDTPGEIAALRQTLALSPGWGSASRRLSAALEKSRDPAGAEHALLRARAASPADPVTHAWLGDLFWRTGRPAEAIEAMEQALRCDPAYEWAWDQLHAWSMGLHRASRAIPLAEELAAARPGEPASWLRLANLRDEAEHTEANLDALARAEALDPLDFEIHDARARLLVRAQRWAEALAACAPAAYKDRPPHPLRGRSAWIRAQAGRTDEAVKLMRAVLDEHPDYVWGWTQLTEWLSASGDDAGAERAAERWAVLSPRNPVPLGWLGDLRRRQGKKSAALDTFRRALDLHPDYGYAARELLDEQLKAGDLDAARATADHVGAHFTRAEHLRALGLIQARQKDHDAALATFVELARRPDAQGDQLDRVFRAILEKGYHARLGKALAGLLAAEDSHPALAEFWIAAQEKRWTYASAWSFRRLRPADAHRRALLTQYISFLASRRAGLPLRVLQWTRGTELRADAEWWGELGYAWSHLGRFRAVARWMRDWERADAKPYMLSNLALAWFSRNRPARAMPVVLRAASLPSDQTYTKLQAWIALEAALAGDNETAKAALATGVPPKDKPYNLALHGLAEALVNFAELPAPERKARLDEVLSEVEALRADHAALAAGPALRIHFVRTRRRLASLSGKWTAIIRTRLPRISSSSTAPDDTTPFEFSWWHGVLVFIALKGCVQLAMSQ